MVLPLLVSLSVALPDVGPPPPIKRAPQIIILDREGRTLATRGGRYGPPVDVAALPAYVPAAFVSIEDRRFYSHDGFDPVGMARALATDLTTGHAAQGASTITQQLARNLYLTADKTLERKADELVLAVQLENAYSKAQILGLYLSRIYFGAGAYGIEAASQRYFHKPARGLTLAEAAVLAALPKSPSEYNPIDHPDRSSARAALVLDVMVEAGAITPADRARALAHPPKVYSDPPAAPAAYFVDWVEGAVHRLAPNPAGDLYVETTLDLPSQFAADAAAQAAVKRYADKGVEQAALVSLDGEGRVRALVGGIDHAASQYDRALEAHRQVGSAWKPFVYLAALQSGRTPETVAVDEPVTIEGWSPRNFEPDYLGPITLRTALIHSVNTVAARLADEVGRDRVAAQARTLGIVSTIAPGPAMALGTSLITPVEMAQAYDAFGNGGYKVRAYAIERIRTGAGAVVYRHAAAESQPVIPNPALSDLNAMLRGVVAEGTGTRAAIPGYDLAGKTGTTSDFKDAWFCGYTGGLATAVWLGRDDNSPMRGITGGSAPADLWRGYMTVALGRLPHGPIAPGAPPPAPPPATPAPSDVPPPPAPPSETTAPPPDATPATPL